MFSRGFYSLSWHRYGGLFRFCQTSMIVLIWQKNSAKNVLLWMFAQPAIPCLKLTIETLEQGLAIYLMLTLNIPCSSVPLVNFEQVNAGWVTALKRFFIRSRSKMFYKICDVKNVTKITGKHLRWCQVAGLLTCKFIKERLQHRCFTVNFKKLLMKRRETMWKDKVRRRIKRKSWKRNQMIVMISIYYFSLLITYWDEQELNSFITEVPIL